MRYVVGPKITNKEELPVLLPSLKVITVIAVSVLFLSLIQPKANAQNQVIQLDVPPASCHVTLPTSGQFQPTPGISTVAEHYSHARGRFLYGNGKLSTVLPTDGIWRTMFSDPTHGAYSTKLPWFRLDPSFSQNDGPLSITLTALGAPPYEKSTTYRGDAHPNSGDTEVNSNIFVPMVGCWQITGKYKDQELTFTVWVSSNNDRKPLWSF
jgi:hypothetical protein